MKKTVFVGMSGGVDSSVAALRLKNEGYNVVGVFIKVWHPDFMVCNWEAERLDAMRVAANLDIPFLTCNAEETYKKEVADYFINEYVAGRTPNPDVMCNKAVKFGAFMEFAKEKGADFIATGHYVQKIDNKLYRGNDNNKDQSYFLWSLTQEQLDYSLFPIGSTPKEVVRQEAAAANIPTATKKDSQGVCFLGHIDIPEFLSHFTELKKGSVVNESGEVIGEHKGALVYTIGQRHGFTLNTKDTNRGHMFVVAKDLEKNTITVSTEQPKGVVNEKLNLHNCVIRTKLETDDEVSIQLRYRQTPLKAKVISISEQEVTLEIEEESEKSASGQSCVIYLGDECIGGGIVA